MKSSRVQQTAEKIAEFLRNQANQAPTTHSFTGQDNIQETWTYAKKDQILPHTENTDPETDCVAMETGFFILANRYNLNREGPKIEQTWLGCLPTESFVKNAIAKLQNLPEKQLELEFVSICSKTTLKKIQDEKNRIREKKYNSIPQGPTCA